MVETTAMQQEPEPTARRIKSRSTPMTMCPMAAMCKGMMEKPPSGVVLMFPGAVLIVMGVLVFLEPQILVWLMGAAFVLLGIMFFMMTKFIRRFGLQLREL